MNNDPAHLVGEMMPHDHSGVVQQASAGRRGMWLALLVSVWVIGLGCFPVFTPEISRKSNQLSGSIRDEVGNNQERLFIIGTEERQGLRRYRLALVGLLNQREVPAVIEFVHDEATGQVAIVRETRSTGPLPVGAKEIRMVRQYQLSLDRNLNGRGEQIAEALTNDGMVPTSVFIEPIWFGQEHVALQFHYRDRLDIIRRANLVVIPRALNQHPGLGALNRLNYLWSVPADTVVVVVGWAIFWPLGAAVTSNGGFHVGP